MNKLRIDQYLAVMFLCLIFLVPIRTQPPAAQAILEVKLLDVAAVPILEDQLIPESFVASLSAQSVVVIDVPSASKLLEKNPHLKASPASTTKMMTALVAQELFSLDQVIAIKKQPLNIGHTIGFAVGEEFLVQDILRALLINSGNDAAEILAQNHSQGAEAFIMAMNQAAARLHLENTFFTNPSGLDAAAHYSTAFDLSLIARELMKDEFLKSLVAVKQVNIVDLSGKHTFDLQNTNVLLGREEGVVGIKTGTTDLAGEALVTLVEKDNKQVLIVVLGSQDRYLDTTKIIDWVFSHYQWAHI